MAAFDRDFLNQLTAAAPRWRASQMEAAFDVFEALDEPSGAEEDWRYVDFDLTFDQLSPAPEPGEPLGRGPYLQALGETSGHVLILDGHVVEADSDKAELRRFDDSAELSVTVPPDLNKLAAAHTTFAGDGVLVRVADRMVIDTPLVIEIQASLPDTASFPHVGIEIGSDAEASVLLVYRSLENTGLLMVPEVSATVGDGGRLKLVSLQDVDQAASNIVHQRIKLERGAALRLGEVGLGGDLARLDLAIDLVGDGSSSDFSGVYFGEQQQTLDYRVVINHHGENTSSDVFLKGALEDDAESVFTGLLRIEKDARKTSTFETNRNLVLSENAKAHSVPNLEILCDDVICGHGSSVGPLDHDQMYYLQSRGLRKERAERLLIRGFFTEAIDRLPIGGLGDQVSAAVFERFEKAQAEGRVA